MIQKSSCINFLMAHSKYFTFAHWSLLSQVRAATASPGLLHFALICSYSASSSGAVRMPECPERASILKKRPLHTTITCEGHDAFVWKWLTIVSRPTPGRRLVLNRLRNCAIVKFLPSTDLWAATFCSFSSCQNSSMKYEYKAACCIEKYNFQLKKRPAKIIIINDLNFPSQPVLKMDLNLST